MPLEKYYRGRRVLRTKRRGNFILVKLTQSENRASAAWISVLPEEYEQGLSVTRSVGSHLATDCQDPTPDKQ
ncbi:hypothetical protein ETAA8_13310 [Anatilimnocola aggregata]|uniref:Uncharacterized protein n=1 Tax=Anatilimnocola aggregata TaxID=2528021 RepID=A0A517Y7T0_9BACT|nr:hypothetical protein ETAA8_13310 [Anatilimnocola aggregata]